MILFPPLTPKAARLACAAQLAFAAACCSVSLTLRDTFPSACSRPRLV